MSGHLGETAAAIVFYVGVAALAVGAMLAARRQIEGRAGADRRALGLMLCGLACVAIAVIVFANGPRGVLPF